MLRQGNAITLVGCFVVGGLFCYVSVTCSELHKQDMGIWVPQAVGLCLQGPYALTEMPSRRRIVSLMFFCRGL